MINHPNRSKVAITQDVARKVLEIVDAGLVKNVGIQKAGSMCIEAAVCFALGLPHGDDPACVSRALRSLNIKLNDSNWSSSTARAKGLRRLAVIQLGSRDVLDDHEFAKRVAKLTIQTCVPVALRATASVQKDPTHAKSLRDAANVCEREGTRESALAANKIAAAADSAYPYAYAAAAYAAAAAAYAADYAAAAAYAAAAYPYAAYAAAVDSADSAAYAAYAAAAAYAADACPYAAAAYAADSAYPYAYAAAAYAADAYADRDKVLSDFAEGVVQILIDMKVPGAQWLPLTEVAA